MYLKMNLSRLIEFQYGQSRLIFLKSSRVRIASTWLELHWLKRQTALTGMIMMIKFWCNSIEFISCFPLQLI